MVAIALILTLPTVNIVLLLSTIFYTKTEFTKQMLLLIGWLGLYFGLLFNLIFINKIFIVKNQTHANKHPYITIIVLFPISLILFAIGLFAVETSLVCIEMVENAPI
jgi:hypothetical protein